MSRVGDRTTSDPRSAISRGEENDGYVRVGVLRSALDGLPDDMLVVLSKDGEGNGFSPLAEVEHEPTTGYIAESTWAGEVPHPDDYEDGDGVPCVVLWPTN